MSNLGSRIVDVIEIRIHSGKGTKEEPYKFSRQYWSKEGEFLCEIDEKSIMPRVETDAQAETINSEPTGKITKDFALSIVRAVRRFIKARYYMPNMVAFSGWPDFEGWMHDLCGLENYINGISEDLSALDKNS